MNQHMEDWLSEVCESPKTEVSYVRNIGLFSKFAVARNLDLEGIVEAWRKVKRADINEREDFLDVWSDLVRAYNTRIKKRYAPLSVKNLLSTVKSFFSYWQIPIRVKLPKRACVIYHNKDLTREVVRQILTFASARDRVMWLLMAESGMRADTIVNMKYWQIREDFEAERIPMKIMLPSSSLKDHVGDRFTFIGEDGYRELKQYLEGRRLEDQDYVFASERPGRVEGLQFSVASLSVKFSRVVIKLNLAKPTEKHKPKPIRMHSLRKYFRNNIKADSAYIKFWGGWSLGTDAHYISRDPEKHREEYRKGYAYLRIYDIEPMISREDIERIVEVRVEERIEDLTRKHEEEMQTLRSMLLAPGRTIEDVKRIEETQKEILKLLQKQGLATHVEEKDGKRTFSTK